MSCIKTVLHPVPQDQEPLRQAGVAAFFGPGTRVPAAALDLLGLLLEEAPQPSQSTA